MTMLANDEADRFKQDGLLVLRQLLDAETLEPVRESIADYADDRIKKLVAAGAVSDPHEEAPFETRWAIVSRENKLQIGEHSAREWGGRSGLTAESIYNLGTDSRLTDIIASIIGPELLLRGDYWVRPSVPESPRTTFPWHRDSHYYGSSTGPNFNVLTVWIPLVDVDENNGCLKLVRGSNQHESIEKPVDEASKYGTVMSVPMNVGDVLIFSNLTLHASGDNTSDHVRWSIDMRYSPFNNSADLDASHPGMVVRSDNQASVMSFAQWDERLRARWGEPIGKA